MNQSQTSERPRILIAGDAAVPTGFARVLESVFLPLKDKYEIHHLGANYSGDPHDYPWKVYPAALGGDTWGAHRLVPLLERLKPRLVFIVNDIWIQHSYLAALAKLVQRPPLVLYCPVDGGPLDPETIAPLVGITRFVVYTEFARSQVAAALAAQRQKVPTFAFPEIEIIPHGVDTEVFYPLLEQPVDGQLLSGRVQARRLILPDTPDRDERFIVLNANRNQPRKRIDITLRGFALFAQDKPAHVKLYLHMGSEDRGWNVIQLARRYGIEDRLIMPGLAKQMPHSSLKQLNLIYNACDVGLNTATSEGWGLTSFEHAATGAAQIVPRHSACAELWEEAGVMLEPVLSIINEKILTEGWLVTPESVAAALERLYRERDYLAEMSAKAYRRATRPEYGWKRISGQWDRLFQEVLAQS